MEKKSDQFCRNKFYYFRKYKGLIMKSELLAIHHKTVFDVNFPKNMLGVPQKPHNN